MAIQRLSHVGICVSDLERSLHFYRDALGFETRTRLEIGGEPTDRLLELEGTKLRAVYLERDGVRIELLHYESPGVRGDGQPRPMNALGLTHFSLRVDDLAAVLAIVRDAGGFVLEDSHIELPETSSAAAFVTDPDGTRIELVQAPGDPSDLPGG